MSENTNQNPLLIPIAIIIAGGLIAFSVFATRQEPQPAGADVNVAANQDLPEEEPPVSEETFTTSIDNDPYLGNRETAKVAIVEFSDYECPFCQRYTATSAGALKKKYVDSGEAIMVFRDLPLAFHDPAATKLANAAECVREQTNDETYFEYHDYIFENTAGNGAGIPDEEFIAKGVELGAEQSSLQSCVDEEKYADEIKADIDAAAEISLFGTPGFLIGTLNEDGSVEGNTISGAQPTDIFEQVVDEKLGK